MDSKFLSEMTEVQEAFRVWQAEHYDDNKIPSIGIVQLKDIEENGRLYGEIAYYRRWSETGTIPEISVELNEKDFNKIYDGDLNIIPRGVEDLYYVDNEKLGIEGSKKYIIDAVNGMVYSLLGYNIKENDVHSLAMYRALANGVTDSPAFAKSVLAGSGDDIIYAGEKYYRNKNGQYLDKDGNVLEDQNNEEDRVINPNGFEIIGEMTNDNIYKLYNNGDLYGKGVKGTLLNTPKEEMEKLNSYKWAELTIPSQIPGYNDIDKSKIAIGGNTIYVIDESEDLWAWGDNSYNKLGLSPEQIENYTGLEAVKLNVDGKKVSKVFATSKATFVLTKDEENYELYASGYNVYGELGTGEEVTSTEKFKKVEFDSPDKIVDIAGDAFGCNALIVQNGDYQRLFFAGQTIDDGRGDTPDNVVKYFKDSEYSRKNVSRFVEVSGTKFGNEFDKKIRKYFPITSGNQSLMLGCIDDNGNGYIYSLSECYELRFGENEGKVLDAKGCSPGQVIFKYELNDGNIQYWVWTSSFYPNPIFNKLDGFVIGTPFLLDSFFPRGFKGNDIEDFDFGRSRE